MKVHRRLRHALALTIALLSLVPGTTSCNSDDRPAELTGFAATTLAASEVPSAKAVFTFDVVSRQLYERALPIFSEHGVPAVVYAESGPMDSGESWVMSWAQLRDFQDRHGWEVGSHSITHPDLTLVSDQVLDQELRLSRDRLVSNGLRVSSFATPYGHYDRRVLAATAKYYESHRAASGGPNIWLEARNDYDVRCAEITPTTRVDEVKEWIDRAIAQSQTVVFLLHEVVPGVPRPYEYNEQDLRAIVAYAVSRPIEITTLRRALQYASGPNLITNPSFSQLQGGWATGWQRNDATYVTIDQGGHGNVSGAAQSAKLVGGGPQRTLSRVLAVDGSTRYALRMFQNVQDLRAGGLAVWIDEFNSVGAWLSGQWLGGTYQNFVGLRHYPYTPSSSSVRSINLTIYTERNSQLTLFLDSVELRASY